MKKIILFFRRYKQFQGGHLKVWDYFNHVLHSDSFEPRIYFSEDSVWDETNPWYELKKSGSPLIVDSPEQVEPSALFVAGKDWLFIKEEERRKSKIPVINLIQHVRHADPSGELYSFLHYKAIRIAVSFDVEQALLRAAIPNGTLLTIENCIDLSELPHAIPYNLKPNDILIDALKNPETGYKILQEIRNKFKKIDIIDKKLSRREYFQRINSAKIVVLLPNYEEGFFLPALEAMSLGSLVICPDCIGNRSFCKDFFNCLMPSYNINTIIYSIDVARSSKHEVIQEIINNGLQTAKNHDIHFERKKFLQLLENLYKVWSEL